MSMGMLMARAHFYIHADTPWVRYSKLLLEYDNKDPKERKLKQQQNIADMNKQKGKRW